MNLTLPVPTVTLGPTYATQNNTAFDAVDAHDHSTGKGVQVTPAGLNIDRDFDIAQQIMTNIGQARLFSQAGTLSGASDLRTVYAVGDDLHYRDGSGNNVRITTGGALDASSIGGISGLVAPAAASWVSASTKYLWETDSAQGINATMEMADIIIKEALIGANGITIESPASLASAYTLTLPTALPSSITEPLLVSTSGVISTGQIQTANIASSAVNADKLNTDAVENAKIKDKAVSKAKQESITFNTDGTDPGVGGISKDSLQTGSKGTAGFTNASSAILTTTGRPVMVYIEYGNSSLNTLLLPLFKN